MHLAEHHGAEILRPGDRSLISQWTHFANSTLAFAIFVPDQKAVIASGFAKTERVHETQNLGAGSYIKKPYTLEKIGLAVRAELDREDEKSH